MRSLLVAAPLVDGLIFKHFESLKRPSAPFPRTFESAVDACCDCFEHKNSWPGNGGNSENVAPEKLCDTCYVHDRYGVDHEANFVTGIMGYDNHGDKSSADAEREAIRNSKEYHRWGFAPQTCADRCDSAECPYCCRWSPCVAGTCQEFTFEGAGACDRLMKDATFLSQLIASGRLNEGDSICDELSVAFNCPTSCKMFNCPAGAGGAYTEDTAEVQAVHEFHWNCEEGNLQKKCTNNQCVSDMSQWQKGPVLGEPKGSRGPYKLCDANARWYCANKKKGTSLRMDGTPNGEVEELDTSADQGGDGSEQASEVYIVNLPVLDKGQMTA